MMIHEYIYFINSKQTSILPYVCTCMCLMQDSDPGAWIPNEISACRSNMAVLQIWVLSQTKQTNNPPKNLNI